MNIDILGVGYVGLTLGLALAKQGVNVVGKDIDRKKLDALKNGTTDIKRASDSITPRPSSGRG